MYKTTKVQNTAINSLLTACRIFKVNQSMLKLRSFITKTNLTKWGSNRRGLISVCFWRSRA